MRCTVEGGGQGGGEGEVGEIDIEIVEQHFMNKV